MSTRASGTNFGSGSRQGERMTTVVTMDEEA
jgi:hypothetical protein